VPRGLPDPRAIHYTQKLLEAVLPVLSLTQGRAFILFTSHHALNEVYRCLKDSLPFPIFCQGKKSKRELIQHFLQHQHSVLLGTSGFWYGVDIPGDALMCVIIDKLPFESPDNPVLKARARLIKNQGKDPFYACQLPDAVLMLKQGAGRLIRTEKDRGVLVVCDPRIVGSRYGNIFVQSLPPMLRTRELATVEKFLSQSDDELA
jgi:ATP-dependent DNA helicase DinG